MLGDIATFVHSCHHVAGKKSAALPEAGPSRSEAGPAASVRGGGIPTGVIMSGSSVQVRAA